MIKRKGNKTFKKVLIGLAIIPTLFVGSAMVIGFYEGFTGKELVKEETQGKDNKEAEIKSEEVKEVSKEQERDETINKIKQEEKARIDKVEVEASELLLILVLNKTTLFELDKLDFSSSGRIKLNVTVVDDKLKNDMIISKLADKDLRNETYKTTYDNFFKVLYECIIFEEGEDKLSQDEFYKEYSPTFIFNDTNGKQILRVDNFMIDR